MSVLQLCPAIMMESIIPITDGDPGVGYDLFYFLELPEFNSKVHTDTGGHIDVSILR